MKKLLAAFLVLSITLASCKKEDDTTEPPDAGGGNSVPSVYSQKVIVECFNSTNGGYCPDGDYKIDQIISSNNGKAIAVCIHGFDAMECSVYSTMDATFGISGWPVGMVNRIPSLGNTMLNRTQWATNVAAQLGNTAKCGLAISSTINGTAISVEVKAAFNTALSGDYRITVYLVEDEVTGTGFGYDQANSLNTDPSSPFYNAGNPIVGYSHDRVVRKALSADLGDAISSSSLVAGGIFTKTYTTSITGYDQTKLFVVAFVNKAGTNGTNHEILNAQEAKVGITKNWD
jgi:hypothetical protein